MQYQDDSVSTRYLVCKYILIKNTNIKKKPVLNFFIPVMEKFAKCRIVV